jgi:hypothetical protein
MAPAPVVIVDVNDVEAAAGTTMAQSTPKVDQNGRKVIKYFQKYSVGCFSGVEFVTRKNAWAE